MLKRTTAFILITGGWLLSGVLDWMLTAWLDENVNDDNISAALLLLKNSVELISGSAGLGFVLGAAIFSIWDWPLIRGWVAQRRRLSRDQASDEALAKRCEEASKYLFDQWAQLERIRSEKHFKTASASLESSDEMHKAWSEARAEEAREEERVKHYIGPEIQRIFIELEGRGAEIDRTSFSLSHYDWEASSYFMGKLADALRTGSYLNKPLTLKKSGFRQND